MKTITVVLIFLLVFTVIKLSAIVEISKLMKPSEKQIEEARQKRIQAQKEGKDTFEEHTIHGDANITDDVSSIRNLMNMNYDIKR